jgi:hypothetical protein
VGVGVIVIVGVDVAENTAAGKDAMKMKNAERITAMTDFNFVWISSSLFLLNLKCRIKRKFYPLQNRICSWLFRNLQPFS